MKIDKSFLIAGWLIILLLLLGWFKDMGPFSHAEIEMFMSSMFRNIF